MKSVFILLIVLVMLSTVALSFKTSSLFPTLRKSMTSSSSLAASLFDFDVEDAAGVKTSLGAFRGKKAYLVVNVASK